jgi:V8-like Glu-specific endopeptidase
LIGALEGSPRGLDLLAQMNLDGPPHGVAVHTLHQLSAFGRVTADKEALGVLLNYLLFFKSDVDEDAQFIRHVIAHYRLDQPLFLTEHISGWRGTESAASTQEVIIGEDTLRHVRMLELAVEAAKSVVRIGGSRGVGSGFMVASDLLMTNHHVLETASQAAEAEVMFNYQLNREGRPSIVTTSSLDPDATFYTCEALDFTIVQVRTPPVFGDGVCLRPAAQRVSARVAIIQHPGGHYKKISMQSNFVAYADARVVQYVTSTMPGSSGSPVFDDEFRAVAIHHSGGTLQQPGTGAQYRRNEGTSVIAVLENLQQNQSSICSRLRVFDTR